MVRAALSRHDRRQGRRGAPVLPYDVMKQKVDTRRDIWAQPEHARFPAMRYAPDPADVTRAAAILAESRAPVIICGGGRGDRRCLRRPEARWRRPEGRGMRDRQRARQPGRPRIR